MIINARLILVSQDIEQKIIDTAVKLDGIRRLLGDRPLHVNSWYRPASYGQIRLLMLDDKTATTLPSAVLWFVGKLPIS